MQALVNINRQEQDVIGLQAAGSSIRMSADLAMSPTSSLTLDMAR